MLRCCGDGVARLWRLTAVVVAGISSADGSSWDCAGRATSTTNVFDSGPVKNGSLDYLLNSDTKQLLLSAIDTVAANQPSFTGMVSGTLRQSFLTKGHVNALSARERTVSFTASFAMLYATALSRPSVQR
jgi:hypothetical protein